MMRRTGWVLAVVLAWGVLRTGAVEGLWNMEELAAPPRAEWGSVTGLLRTVYYEGAAFSGRATRIYACYGRPAQGSGPFPAVVLVHGGGGKVFPDWVTHWAKRGYVALAMDLAGQGPAGRLPDGGPGQDDGSKFRDFTPEQARDMWTYHAVTAVIRGHSLLLARPEVDTNRTAVTGISWGGYLTCIVAGVDHRFKAAVPVYGCGFLGANSFWVPGHFARMPEERRARWLAFFDPSSYLGDARCPMLFVNGTCDFAYPLDSYKKSYERVKAPVALSIEINRKHGHFWSFPEVDAFVDHHVNGGAPLPAIGAMQCATGVVSAAVAGPVPMAAAELDYTADTGVWQKRAWRKLPAEVRDGRVSARLPAERPLVYYLRVTDARGLSVTAPHVELPAAP